MSEMRAGVVVTLVGLTLLAAYWLLVHNTSRPLHSDIAQSVSNAPGL